MHTLKDEHEHLEIDKNQKKKLLEDYEQQTL